MIAGTAKFNGDLIFPWCWQVWQNVHPASSNALHPGQPRPQFLSLLYLALPHLLCGVGRVIGMFLTQLVRQLLAVLQECCS